MDWTRVLLFDPAVYARLAERYDAAIWPAQLVAGVVLCAGWFLIHRGDARGNRAVSALLAGFWVWAGVVFHGLHYASINFAAYGFGALFVIQGVLFVRSGVVRDDLAFGAEWGVRYGVGVGLMAMGAVYGPLAPDPLLAMTAGLLVLSDRRVPVHVLVIPVLWWLVAMATAWLLAQPAAWPPGSAWP